MTETIVITGAATVIVHIDPAYDGGGGVDGAADRVQTRFHDRIGPNDPPRPAGAEAGRRAREDAAIDAEDALTQADEANALDPVG